MANTVTALWNQNPQKLFDWICQVRDECAYDIKKISDLLREKESIIEPTENERESIELLLVVASMEEANRMSLFQSSKPKQMDHLPLSNDYTVHNDFKWNNFASTPRSDVPARDTAASNEQNSRRGHEPKQSQSRHVVVEQLVVKLVVLRDAIRPFVDTELQNIIAEFVLQHTHKRIDMVNASQREYQLIEPINTNDEFSGWNFDVLFGMLQVMLKLPNDAPFPLSWSTQRDRTKLSVTITQSEAKREQQVSLNHPSLEEWLSELCSKTKMPHYYQQWLKLLKDAHVDRLQHLLDWTSERWQALKMPPNAKDIIHRAMVDFRYQDSASPSNNKYSKAEQIANVHRVKRFFYFHLGKQKKIEIFRELFTTTKLPFLQVEPKNLVT